MMSLLANNSAGRNNNGAMKPPIRRPSDETPPAPTSPEKDVSTRNNSVHTCATAAETLASEMEYRRVCFAAAIEKYYYVERRQDFTKEERSSYWSSKTEIKKTFAKVDKLADRLQAGKPEKRSSPYRGIDTWTSRGAQEMKTQLSRTFHAVMDEQQLQRTHNIADPHRMANVCQAVTAVSTRKALNVAYQDEIAAAAIYGASHTLEVFGDDDSTVGSMASFEGRKRKSGTKKSRRSRRNGCRRADRPKTTTTSTKKHSKKKE